MTPCEIAPKALLVNISDVLASGSEAKYFSISLSGNLDENFIQEFYQGLNEISKEYNIKLIGGDLTKSSKITISITIFGDYKNRNISSRKNAKPNYILAVLGEFGSSTQGLYNLQNNIKDNYFIKLHKKPVLYPDFCKKIAKNSVFPYAMMDSSDGLVDCLYQISQKSNVKIKIDYSKIPHKTSDKNFVLYGGEDYSLVIALHQKDFEKFPELIQIGEIKEGEGIFLNNEKLEYKSYEHFN